MATAKIRFYDGEPPKPGEAPDESRFVMEHVVDVPFGSAAESVSHQYVPGLMERVLAATKARIRKDQAGEV